MEVTAEVKVKARDVKVRKALLPRKLQTYHLRRSRPVEVTVEDMVDVVPSEAVEAVDAEVEAVDAEVEAVHAEVAAGASDVA